MIAEAEKHILLKLDHIGKKYGSNQILDKVSFEVYPSQIVALIGDNGAGKSTLVKIITGYIQPDAGSIYWNNQRIRFNHFNAPRQARCLGIQAVYQHLALVDELSLWRNFFLGNELIKHYGPFRRLDIKRMQQLTQESLANFKLLRQLNPCTPVKTLSGGERQILAICRAKYFNAKLLILDEPTSALSPQQAYEVIENIKRIAATGMAIIFITHRMEHVAETADRIIQLAHGSLVINKHNNQRIYL
ncbi:ATP-binding cassette domain-containing protein [Legionella quateirensis]|uniref:ABC sugar transporter, ATP binding protein n=1 Tax=Legionella quateirensis TaxID=45072 RepID=A0A378KUZ4_9GAMM|nr:ATP-binding cassette domain-containing protein [Legionella quateirensis]KTD43694.1 ABC sugar transporter, ATP binding protein [Legionella quateirensis]STY17317.1 ABC sugar transporter, ATP binding protein [Legionella quateirensis]